MYILGWLIQEWFLSFFLFEPQCIDKDCSKLPWSFSLAFLTCLETNVSERPLAFCLSNVCWRLIWVIECCVSLALLLEGRNRPSLNGFAVFQLLWPRWFSQKVTADIFFQPFSMRHGQKTPSNRLSLAPLWFVYAYPSPTKLCLWCFFCFVFFFFQILLQSEGSEGKKKGKGKKGQS